MAVFTHGRVVAASLSFALLWLVWYNYSSIPPLFAGGTALSTSACSKQQQQQHEVMRMEDAPLLSPRQSLHQLDHDDNKYAATGEVVAQRNKDKPDNDGTDMLLLEQRCRAHFVQVWSKKMMGTRPSKDGRECACLQSFSFTFLVRAPSVDHHPFLSSTTP